VHPAQRAGRDRRGVLSFGYLFFAQAKKSESLAAASETRAVRQFIPFSFAATITNRSLACCSG
jgi:hypothetical protein